MRAWEKQEEKRLKEFERLGKYGEAVDINTVSTFTLAKDKAFTSSHEYEGPDTIKVYSMSDQMSDLEWAWFNGQPLN